MSLLAYSRQVAYPFTKVMASVFYLSFSALDMACASISNLGGFSDFSDFSSATYLDPSIGSVFFPRVIVLVVSGPFVICLVHYLCRMGVVPWVSFSSVVFVRFVWVVGNLFAIFHRVT